MTSASIEIEAPRRTIARGWARVLAGGVRGKIGLAFIGFIATVALIGPHVAPYSPTAIGLTRPLGPLSVDHLLGTDLLGRDVFSRVLNGGRLILILPILATVLTVALGGAIGIWSGFRGGWIDEVATRCIDVAISVPPLLFIIVAAVVFGGSSAVLVIVVGVFFAPRTARILRSVTQTVTAEDYVVAARARGEGSLAIVWHEILPNLTGPLLAESAIRLNYAIIVISTMNFLGLGVQPPSSDWGLMASDGRLVLAQAPLLTLAPALAIVVLAVGVNLVSDEVASHLSRNWQRDVRL